MASGTNTGFIKEIVLIIVALALIQFYFDIDIVEWMMRIGQHEIVQVVRGFLIEYVINPITDFVT